MNKYTARRKRRRANAKWNAKRAHKTIGGRKGGKNRKKLASLHDASRRKR